MSIVLEDQLLDGCDVLLSGCIRVLQSEGAGPLLRHVCVLSDGESKQRLQIVLADAIGRACWIRVWQNLADVSELELAH